MINGTAPATRESLPVTALSHTNVSHWTLRSGVLFFFFHLSEAKAVKVFTLLFAVQRKGEKVERHRDRRQAKKWSNSANGVGVSFRCCMLS